ncbi:hypothetical protein ACFSQ7_08465 [Paenibacillus rhizoplanae]
MAQKRRLWKWALTRRNGSRLFNDIAAEDWDVVISGGSEITEMFNATAEANPDKKIHQL